MTRIDFRPWAGVALCVAVLAYVGCSSSSPTGSSASSSTGARRADRPVARAVAASTSQKPLANLGNPAAVLIVSGEQFGYLEPCGCSEGQIGGLLRRYDFLERLHDQNHWPTAPDRPGEPDQEPGRRPGRLRASQAQVRLFPPGPEAPELQRHGIERRGPENRRGRGPGPVPQLPGRDDQGRRRQRPAGRRATRRSSGPASSSPAGPVKLGVTAVIDPESLRKLADPDQDTLLPTVKRPEEVLPGVLADLEPKSDYQVLMVQGPPALAKRLADGLSRLRYRRRDVGVRRRVDPRARDGSTAARPAGRRRPEGEVRRGLRALSQGDRSGFATSVVTLDQKFDGPAKAMKALIEDEYRDMLRQVQVVEQLPGTTMSTARPGATFVGAENCKSCHPKTYEKWATTGHAEAFESLVNDPKPNTIYDAECITCHTTGFEYNSGWHSKDRDALPGGQPVRELPRAGIEAHRRARERRVPQADGRDRRTGRQERALHRTATIGDNSPHFDFAKYYGRSATKDSIPTTTRRSIKGFVAQIGAERARPRGYARESQAQQLVTRGEERSPR